jgi:hypothetical protein
LIVLRTRGLLSFDPGGRPPFLAFLRLAAIAFAVITEPALLAV